MLLCYSNDIVVVDTCFMVEGDMRDYIKHE